MRRLCLLLLFCAGAMRPQSDALRRIGHEAVGWGHVDTTEDRRHGDPGNPDNDEAFVDPTDLDNPVTPKLPPFQLRLTPAWLYNARRRNCVCRTSYSVAQNLRKVNDASVPWLSERLDGDVSIRAPFDTQLRRLSKKRMALCCCPRK